MQTCNFNPNTTKTLKFSGTTCQASLDRTTCQALDLRAISQKLSSLKPDSENTCAAVSAKIEVPKDNPNPTRKTASRKGALATAFAVVLSSCAPDILLSEQDASAEVSRVDAAEENPTDANPDVKKPRKDASLDQEDVSEDISEFDSEVDAPDSDAADAPEDSDVPEDRRPLMDLSDVVEEEAEVPDRVPPRDISDVSDASDAVDEDVASDRVVPPRDVMDSGFDADASLDSDVPEDRPTPPRDVIDAGVDSRADSTVDVVSDTGRDVPVEIPRVRGCSSLTTLAPTSVRIRVVEGCNSPGMSACPAAPRTFGGMIFFADSANGGRTTFGMTLYCPVSDPDPILRVTRIGEVGFEFPFMGVAPDSSFCLTNGSQNIRFTISGFRHVFVPDIVGDVEFTLSAALTDAGSCPPTR